MAAVPTVINAGVFILPCGVVIVPALARVFSSLAWLVKENLFISAL